MSDITKREKLAEIENLLLDCWVELDALVREEESAWESIPDAERITGENVALSGYLNGITNAARRLDSIRSSIFENAYRWLDILEPEEEE